MGEEIDLLKYLLTNIKMQRDLLYKILKKKETKDEIYEFIRYIINGYRKYIISLKQMLKNRIKKYNKESNVLLGVASSIGANVNKVDNNLDFWNVLKENTKVNLLDIERIKNEYNVKSKTIIKLINRLEEFEKSNLDKINLFINAQ